MSSDQRIIEYYQWVLDRIKVKLGTTPSNKPLRYELGHVGGAGIPNNETEENIILKLEELKAIQIINEFPRESGYRHRSIFDLIALQPKFDEVYEEFRIKEVLKNQTAEQALPPSGYIPVNYTGQTINKLNADEIVNSFSPPNYPFVLSVLREISSLVEFSPDNEIYYQLQSSPGQPIIQERMFLKKLEKLRLLKHLGENGISGIATLSDVDVDLIRQIITKIKNKESGVISEDEFDEIKKKYNQTVQELRKSNQSSDLQERYNKITGEIIGSKPKSPDTTLQEDAPGPINKNSFLHSYNLVFNTADGISHYRGANYQFTGKSKALLTFLSTSKNTTFPLEEIKTKCNPNIANKRSHFKGDKDMRDTVNYIRKQLKVNRGEFFPIQKQDNNWIWIEK